MDTKDILLSIHLLTLMYTVWTLFQANQLGRDWMQGKESVLSGEEIRKLHKGISIGLTLMITTGFLMFWPMREYLLTRPPFYVKMTFVLALVINGFVIGHLQKIATYRAYSSLSKRERLPLLFSGAVSTASWAGAATMAFFLIPD